MIHISNLSFGYAGTDTQVLKRVNLEYGEGEFALICGPTGSGKSTLLRALTGLVPHFSGGVLTGSLRVGDVELGGLKPHRFAEVVGYVNQQPQGSFVCETVRDELVYGMEQLGYSQDHMREALARVASVFGLGELLDSPIQALSGGMQQRVAIGAAIAGGQRVLLLDEPTSALDADAAEDLLQLLRDLTRNHGVTVLLAEHRIERALGLVDSVTVVHGDGTATRQLVGEGLDPLLRDYRMVPPMIELARQLGWMPLPLSIEAAKGRWAKSRVETRPMLPSEPGEVLLRIESLGLSYGSSKALDSVNLELHASQITALMGPNGAGKSSLLWSIWNGADSGTVTLTESGVSPAAIPNRERARHIALVPQDAADLLYGASIAQELETADAIGSIPSGTSGSRFAQLAGRVDPSVHPRDLSAGQQLALVLALQMAQGARVLLLDEPTRGLDYEAKRHLVNQLRLLKAQGHAILVATHDVEFVAIAADVVHTMEGGRITGSGNPDDMLLPLGEHAPQLAQITGTAIRLSQVVS